MIRKLQVQVEMVGLHAVNPPKDFRGSIKFAKDDHLSSHGQRSVNEDECSAPTTHRPTGSKMYMYVLFSDQVATETVEAVALFIES